MRLNAIEILDSCYRHNISNYGCSILQSAWAYLLSVGETGEGFKGRLPVMREPGKSTALFLQRDGFVLWR